MKEVSKVPELRFKQDDGSVFPGWEVKRFEEEIEIINGYAFSSSDSTTNGIRWIKIGDVDINKIDDTNPSFLPLDFVRQYSKFQLREGDYIIALTRPILNNEIKIARIPKQLDGSLLNQRVGKFASNHSLTFLFSFFQQKQLINSILNRISGSDPPNLSTKAIRNLKIHLPSLPEQKKIADFLSTVDSKIDALSRQHELLQQYKKGILQRLFPAKGEKTPQLRFKADDGTEFPDWEEKRLDLLGGTFSGLSGKTKENFGRGKPYIQYLQVFSSSRINVDDFGLVDITDDESQNKVVYGDILFTTSSEVANEVAMASVFLDDIKEVYLNSFCFGFRPKSSSKLWPLFSCFVFRQENFRRVCYKLAQGSTRFNISKRNLLRENILLPSLPEQKKIADFLSTLDERIKATATQIEQMKTWKRGLLQKMFV